MSSDHPNAVLVRRLIAAFTAQDRDEIVALIADGCVWRVPGDNALAGEYGVEIRLKECLVHRIEAAQVVEVDEFQFEQGRFDALFAHRSGGTPGAGIGPAPVSDRISKV